MHTKFYTTLGSTFSIAYFWNNSERKKQVFTRYIVPKGHAGQTSLLLQKNWLHLHSLFVCPTSCSSIFVETLKIGTDLYLHSWAFLSYPQGCLCTPENMGVLPGLGTLEMVTGFVVTQALLVTYKMLAGMSPHWTSLPAWDRDDNPVFKSYWTILRIGDFSYSWISWAKAHPQLPHIIEFSL